MVSVIIKLNGKCREAMEFYEDVFDEEIKQIIPYGNYIPEGLENPPENLSKWIWHGEMEIGECNFWFKDELQPLPNDSNSIKLASSLPDAATGQVCFDKLKKEGFVVLQPTERQYTNFHAIVTDKYGICWNLESEEVS